MFRVTPPPLRRVARPALALREAARPRRTTRCWGFPDGLNLLAGTASASKRAPNARRPGRPGPAGRPRPNLAAPEERARPVRGRTGSLLAPGAAAVRVRVQRDDAGRGTPRSHRTWATGPVWRTLRGARLPDKTMRAALRRRVPPRGDTRLHPATLSDGHGRHK